MGMAAFSRFTRVAGWQNNPQGLGDRPTRSPDGRRENERFALFEYGGISLRQQHGNRV
jgi:hypothetical protein